MAALDSISYVKDVEKFRAERIETLTKPDNWLALIGEAHNRTEYYIWLILPLALVIY